MSILVDTQRLLQVEKLLKDRQIIFQMQPDGIPQPPKLKSIPKLLKSRSIKNRNFLDWNDFHPLNLIYSFMDHLEAQFPSTCTVMVIGKTEEGRDLRILKVSNSDAGNSSVWLDGAIHAREWISTSVVTYLADYVARNFETLPPYMTNKDWYFMPVMNPDGYAYTHCIDRMWRKNRAVYDDRFAGVDLNRNFSYQWGRSGDHSSKHPNHMNFRGAEPFSEPETSAVKDFIMSAAMPFKVFLTFHCYSEVITFPWCHSPEPCHDYVSLLEGGTFMAKAIYDFSGHMYKVGSFKDLMYYAAGTSIDWSYGCAHIPFSYLVELRSKESKFILPKEEILVTCQEMVEGMKALMKYVDERKDTSSNCHMETKNKTQRPRL